MSGKIREDKRTTVSLAQVVWEMAEKLMEAKGFNDNFSAYVADLIRRDKERTEMVSTSLAHNKCVGYPNHLSQGVEMNEPQRKKKAG